MKGLAECSKNRLLEALWSVSFSVDNSRGLVAKGELAQLKEVRRIVLPSFNQAMHKDAVAVEGKEVLTLCQNEQGSQKLCVDTSTIPKETWRRTG